MEFEVLKALTCFCLLCCFLLVSGAPEAMAQQDAIDCGNAISQMEMTHCAGVAWEEADAALNDYYRAAMTAMRSFDTDLPPELQGAADSLRDAQRAWIPYRDKACDAYGFLARGGTLEPQLVLSCRADLTWKRVEELRELAEGFGN